jgi:hypothetical protein
MLSFERRILILRLPRALSLSYRGAYPGVVSSHGLPADEGAVSASF